MQLHRAGGGEGVYGEPGSPAKTHPWRGYYARVASLGETTVGRTATQTWGFVLFILVTGTLFLRPADLFSSMQGSRIYLVLIALCLAAALPGIAVQFSIRSLIERPVTACVVGLLAMVVCSHLANLSFWHARNSGFEFSKVFVYYLLCVHVIDCPSRVRRFLLWLLGFIALTAALALLNSHGMVKIDALQSLTYEELDARTGDVHTMERLRSTGIFHDPNDLALILVVGVVLCLDFFFEPGWGFVRLVWLGPLLLCSWALALTHSRGGFLALLAALSSLTYLRLGWRRAIPVAAILAPIAFIVFSHRMTDFNAITEGTGQTRIQIWSDSLAILRQNPVFGIGHNEFFEQYRVVAHNSFLHCYAELGFLGGTFFLGAFFAAGLTLFRSCLRNKSNDNPVVRHFPFACAIVAGYAAGALTLSRTYDVPTYTILGLATAIGILGQPGPRPPLRFDGKFVQSLLLISVLFLVALHVFVRVMVRWP